MPDLSINSLSATAVVINDGDVLAVVQGGQTKRAPGALIADKADARIAAAKGAVNGICPLGADQKVAAAYLPSYVDDVLEYANLAAFPATGETGKIYVALNTNATYRWSGSAYVMIASSPGSTDAVPEGSVNLYYTQTRADARVQAAKGTATPAANGVGSAGSGTTWAPIDHVHPTDTSRLAKAGDSMTGTLGVKAVTDTLTTVAPVAGVVTLDLSLGQEFLVNLTGNVTSWTLTNAPTGTFTISVTNRQDSTGGRTVAWTFTGKTLLWAGGTAPTQTSTLNKEDEFVFKSRDSGSTFKGYIAGQNF
jgi:hypothetical protein